MTKEQKAEDDKAQAEKYYSALAKPKDRWAVGHELQELAQQFPHDRVIQRMLQEELKLNPIFRAPEEYDVYKLDEEKPARINKPSHKGLCKKSEDYGA